MVNQPQSRQPSEDLKLETIRWHQKLQEITYLEAGQHMRALNQLMWQIPSFAIAVNGGLWYATTLANEKSLWIIFAVLAFFDITTIATIYRLRYLIGKKIEIQNNIEDPSKNMVLNKISIESGFPMVEIQREPKKGYIVVSCWALMLLACFVINMYGAIHPNIFSKENALSSYKATIKTNSTGIVIEATSGESR
ncbi:TPA: hypothetical protein ACOEBK_000723 [Enterobacter ludwigii]|uniref:hypothetical protein n=1 Tax=Enterobacter ludwigii TaxID=299767 RepID=UPI00243063C5|nr:hypothetical protein [Enterobacter ludwigii]WFY38493.1 hypothetical protein NFK33_11605 [Enterobacter ludwigii]